MTTIRPFTADDLFKFNNVNLDPFTETFAVNFYCHYLATWPDYMEVCEAPDGRIMGHIMGKAEGSDEQWHGHVTSVSIAPEYRRMGLAQNLMHSLEKNSEMRHCYFVDLFVRASNKAAIQMYEKLGYVVYRTVLEYYSGDKDEDALDMRKALSRDVEKKSIVATKTRILPDEIEFG